MARKEIEEAKAIDEASVSLVKRSLGASIQYLVDMERMFDHDTRRLFELVRKHIDSVLEDRHDPAKFDEFQLFARAFVRALFAHVEGVTYLMRQVIIWAHDRGEIALTEAERSDLNEREPMTGKPRFNSLKENFRLAFQHFPKLFGSPYQLDKSGQDWHFFCASIKVRDAITHPKTTSEFKLSSDALREAQRAAVWFNESLRDLLISCSDDQRKGGRLR